MDNWVSNDIVYKFEDAFTRIDSSFYITNTEKIFYILRKIFKNRYTSKNYFLNNIYCSIQKALCKKISDSIFLTCVISSQLDFLKFYRTDGFKIVYIIDAWENDIEYISKRIDDADIVLMAYQDSINLLHKYVSDKIFKKIFLFPVFLDPYVYPQCIPYKCYDIIQVGRKNEILHEWAKRYSIEKKKIYLFQKRNNKGIYYFEDKPWNGNNYQLSYFDLIDTLSKTKIALVSPPNMTNNTRTGSVSPLTPRYLESAMCYSIPVGFTPTSGEYVNFFPKTFTIVPKSYEEFVDICDELLKNNTKREEIANSNKKYVLKNHIVRVRYNQLCDIVNHFLI
jgi:hypothetical protein